LGQGILPKPTGLREGYFRSDIGDAEEKDQGFKKDAFAKPRRRNKLGLHRFHPLLAPREDQSNNLAARDICVFDSKTNTAGEAAALTSSWASDLNPVWPSRWPGYTTAIHRL
jgi:hypothetical protein